jgi:hypothetical protein
MSMYLTGYNSFFLGGFFTPHVDGRRLATVNEQSFMTVNIYLNGVPREYRGATRILQTEGWILQGSGGSRHNKDDIVDAVASIQPVQGLAAVFRHDLLHDGEVLLEGEKYLLRTDVMYSRDMPFDLYIVFPGLSDEEKGRKALDIAARLEDANNQEEALRWYKKAFRLCPALDQ